ncbi:hypothetical protein XarbCFBP7408_08490 [Xanthomonas arboricola pv. guizotiae]|nr:hypothetical protein XarbCFBP7408_08490 [Xanthomonas arboricola pv. guizotiae]
MIVRATVLDGSWSKEMDLTPCVPVLVADGMLTACGCHTPAPIGSETTASASRYAFRFRGSR